MNANKYDWFDQYCIVLLRRQLKTAGKIVILLILREVITYPQFKIWRNVVVRLHVGYLIYLALSQLCKLSALADNIKLMNTECRLVKMTGTKDKFYLTIRNVRRQSFACFTSQTRF
jgi:hypothetical protein